MRRLCVALAPAFTFTFALSCAVSACVPQAASPSVPTTQIHVGEVARTAPLATEPPRREAGDAVEVEWQGGWYAAVILERHGEQWLIHYDGYGSEWDELVGGDRIRDARGATDEPADAPQDTPDDAAADP